MCLIWENESRRGKRGVWRTSFCAFSLSSSTTAGIIHLDGKAANCSSKTFSAGIHSYFNVWQGGSNIQVRKWELLTEAGKITTRDKTTHLLHKGHQLLVDVLRFRGERGVHVSFLLFWSSCCPLLLVAVAVSLRFSGILAFVQSMEKIGLCVVCDTRRRNVSALRQAKRSKTWSSCTKSI